jgi:hypothetical protein
MPISKTASWRNGYCESGFAGKRVHADAIDFWRVASVTAASPTGCWQKRTPLAKRSISAVHNGHGRNLHRDDLSCAAALAAEHQAHTNHNKNASAVSQGCSTFQKDKRLKGRASKPVQLRFSPASA